MGNRLPRVTVFFESEELRLIERLAKREFLTSQAFIRRKVMPVLISEVNKPASDSPIDWTSLDIGPSEESSGQGEAQ